MRAVPIVALVGSFGCAPDGTGVQLSDLGPAGELGRALRADATAPGPASLVCTSDDEPEEDHRLLSVSPSRGHAFEVFGLLADTSYRCRAEAGHGADTVEFHTAPLPDLVGFTVAGETDGYTLLNTQRGPGWDEDASWIVIVDPEGRPRWLYDAGPQLVVDLDAQVVGDTVHVGGGWAYFALAQPNRGVFRDVDLAGRVRVERAAPTNGEGFNHHSTRLEDGTTLSITAALNEVDDNSWVGVGVEQWSPDGVVWSWSSQTLVDAGVLEEADVRSPYTANAVALVDDAWGSAAWVSSYSQKELWRIDRSTGLRTHVFGPGTGFTVVDTNQQPADAPYCQHDPHWSDGPTGPDGRVLLYDNGVGRPGGGGSRVAQYDLDLDTRTATLLWSWTEPGWYNPTLGGADPLPNGNVLIAQGFNVNKTPESDDVSEIVELTPPSEVVWRLTFDDGEWPMYRARRVAGCDLFANARYCSSTR